MAKIIFLGTASSIPTKERDHTSLLFLYKKEKILIDGGTSLSYKLEKLNIRFFSLKDIVITHLHLDHFYGLFNLIHTQAYLNKEINIYAHKISINFLTYVLKIFKIYQKKPYPKINFIDVFSKEPFYQKENFAIFAFKTKHTRESFGIIIKKNKKKIVYTSDTSYFPKLKEIVKNADLLIADSTAYKNYFKKYPRLYKKHLPASWLIKLAKENKVKTLVPIHFLILNKKMQNNLFKELKKYKGKLLIPYDEMVIKF